MLRPSSSPAAALGRERRGQSNANALSIGTTGVAVKIRQGPAFDQLFTWSKRLGDRGATHGEA